MKKLLITLSLLMPFCACYSYNCKQEMDSYFEKAKKDINDDRDRAERYEAQRQQAETNRAIQRELSPLNRPRTPTKVCPG